MRHITIIEARRRLKLSAWGERAARRLSQFREPGAYDFRLVVEPDGTRRLVVRDQPETLGSD